MPTVTIDSNDYTAYATVAEADEYLLADFDATTWRAEADEDAKARALVTASRLLGKVLCVDGTKLEEVDEADIPDAIIHGVIVLAKLIHAGSTVTSSASTASNVRRQKAGSVEIEYFGPTVISDSGRWPVELLDLVGAYFCGSTGIAGAISFGTCGESITETDYTPGWGA